MKAFMWMISAVLYCFVRRFLRLSTNIDPVSAVLILRIYIKRNYPNVYYDAPPTRNLSVTNNRWDALLLQISINTSISLPTIMISQVLGFKEANVYAVYSMIVSIARQLVVLLPAAYLLALLGNVNYVWWSFPIAEIASLPMTTIFLIKINKDVIRHIGEEPG